MFSVFRNFNIQLGMRCADSEARLSAVSEHQHREYQHYPAVSTIYACQLLTCGHGDLYHTSRALGAHTEHRDMSPFSPPMRFRDAAALDP
jgi:hypothetical protein